MNKEKFNFDAAISSIEQIKKMKEKNAAKQSTSIKPLFFEVSEGDSELKKMLIQRINEKKLTYSDLHEYCTEIMNGDILAGKNLGYNIITGLRKRPTMTDVTFHMLCDFIKVDIILKDKEPVEATEEEQEEEDEN